MGNLRDGAGWGTGRAGRLFGGGGSGGDDRGGVGHLAKVGWHRELEGELGRLLGLRF
jgi:hypothetical protein